jgi:hypothetical protein
MRAKGKFFRRYPPGLELSGPVQERTICVMRGFCKNADLRIWEQRATIGLNRTLLLWKKLIGPKLIYYAAGKRYE